MSARTTLPILTLLFFVAWDRSSTTPSSTTVASASAAPAPVTSTGASSNASPKPSAASTPAITRSFLSYQGKVGQSDFRIVLERAGDKLEGIATRGGGGDEVPVRGEMKDANHFTLTEVVGKGKKARHTMARSTVFGSSGPGRSRRRRRPSPSTPGHQPPSKRRTRRSSRRTSDPSGRRSAFE
jgi:hypothetical protein